jgi:DNA invertase Pin-like site-specific DNA recombinase
MASSIVDAAVYYRMSTPKQEDSIDRQRSTCEPYAAAHGYKIVAEYADEGIAGDEFAKRGDLQRLLKDARDGRFRVILVDEPSRLSRQNVMEFIATVAYPLQAAGVSLDTVSKGPVRWDDLGQFIVAAVDFHESHAECLNKSRRVLSQHLEQAKRGEYLGGPAPYAYRLERNPEGWMRLVVDAVKAEHVRLMYRLYDEGNTLIGIAMELKRRGVASPSGRARWSRKSIYAVLTNRKYVGDFVWGKRASGKHNRQANGRMRQRRDGERCYAENAPEEWIVLENNHEPIVDRDLFTRVQARLADSADKSTPHANGGPFLLSKLLVCGHCGAYMIGYSQPTGPRYSCGGHRRYGPDYCHRHTLREGVIVDMLVRKLQEAFLDPDWLQSLREEVRRLEAETRDEKRLERLRRRAQTLEQKLRRGYDQLLSLSATLRDGFQARLEELTAEKEAVQAELQRAEAESPVRDLEEIITAVEAELWRLHEAVQSADPPLLRQVLREFISKVELHFTYYPGPAGRRMSQVGGGVIHLRKQLRLSPATSRRNGRGPCRGTRT